MMASKQTQSRRHLLYSAALTTMHGTKCSWVMHQITDCLDKRDMILWTRPVNRALIVVAASACLLHAGSLVAFLQTLAAAATTP